MKKNKDVVLYHPTVGNCQYNFWELIESMARLDIAQRIVLGHGNDSKYVVDFEMETNQCVIVVQKLKYDDLPRVASETDGRGERILSLPDGMSLSFKNIFVLGKHKEGDVLAMPVLGSCPQVGALRRCLKNIAKESIPGCEHASIDIPVIMKRGLAEQLKRVNEITMAEFTTKDYYGENIPEERLGIYREYLGESNITRKVSLKGLKGYNLKKKLAPILEDIIVHGVPSEDLGIKMTMDGQIVNFSKYYRKYTISVKTDAKSVKSLDYDDLKRATLEIARGHGVDDD